MALVSSSRRPPRWSVTTPRTRRDRARSLGQIRARSRFRIDRIAVRSGTTTLRDQGSLTTGRPDKAPMSRGRLIRTARVRGVAGDTIVAMGADTAGACSIDSIRVWPGPRVAHGRPLASPSCRLGCRPERTSLSAGLAGAAGPATASPTFFPGSDIPRLPRETRSPALAVLRCASALRPPHRAAAMGTPNGVRDRPPPA